MLQEPRQYGFISSRLLFQGGPVFSHSYEIAEAAFKAPTCKFQALSDGPSITLAIVNLHGRTVPRIHICSNSPSMTQSHQKQRIDYSIRAGPISLWRFPFRAAEQLTSFAFVLVFGFISSYSIAMHWGGLRCILLAVLLVTDALFFAKLHGTCVFII